MYEASEPKVARMSQALAAPNSQDTFCLGSPLGPVLLASFAVEPRNWKRLVVLPQVGAGLLSFLRRHGLSLESYRDGMRYRRKIFPAGFVFIAWEQALVVSLPLRRFSLGNLPGRQA